MASTVTKRSLLWPKWCRTFRALNLAEEELAPAYFRLTDAYSDEGRYYHTLDHLDEMMVILDEFRDFRQIDLPELASWFHDVIYDPRAKDNEERSAIWAEKTLREFRIEPSTIQRVSQLILLTKTHRAPSGDLPAAILLDADLAILGAEHARYEQYAAAIRREYLWVPDQDYRAGRTAVLESFLKRERIYQTAKLFATCEERARDNLANEIRVLRNAG